MLRKMISYLLVIALTLMVGKASLIIPVGAIDAGKTETKVLDTATMDDDFTDDCVMVILTNAESLKFRNYTAADFPEVACKSIEDLSSASAARVQAKLRGEEMEAKDAGAAFMNRNVKVDTFRTILCLKLETPGKGNVLKAIRALEQREDVYYAGPNYIITLDLPVTTSSDTSRSTASTNDLTDNIGWGAEAIDLSAAWGIETGKATVNVGILDTGIDITHPDLQGRVNTTLSRNFAPDNKSATTDGAGHGTHVAGIIGGAGNNTLGIRGVCQNVTLVSLRVLHYYALQDKYITDCQTVARAIIYAEQENICILNMSFGVPDELQNTVEQALHGYSGIAICSAGNDNLNTDDNNGGSYPGVSDISNVICVGASTQQNVRWSNSDVGSNYGKQKVDLFAPGHEIASCYPTELCEGSECDDDKHIANGYHYLTGTSMATPYVTGVVALMLSSHDVSPSTVKWIILNRTEQYAAFRNLCVSGGLLNAYNALNDPTLHTIDGSPINATRHRAFCTECNYSAVGYHAYDGTGNCLICGYPG